MSEGGETAKAETILLELVELGGLLAKKYHYAGIIGVQAVQLYLVDKHHWALSFVRGMPVEEMHFILNVELKALPSRKPKPPPEGAVKVRRSIASRLA